MSKDTIFAKNADISKIEMTLVLKGIFSETKYVCVKKFVFEVSKIIITCVRQWGAILPTPTSKQTPKKST